MLDLGDLALLHFCGALDRLKDRLQVVNLELQPAAHYREGVLHPLRQLAPVVYLFVARDAVLELVEDHEAAVVHVLSSRLLEVPTRRHQIARLVPHGVRLLAELPVQRLLVRRQHLRQLVLLHVGLLEVALHEVEVLLELLEVDEHLGGGDLEARDLLLLLLDDRVGDHAHEGEVLLDPRQVVFGR